MWKYALFYIYKCWNIFAKLNRHAWKIKRLECYFCYLNYFTANSLKHFWDVEVLRDLISDGEFVNAICLVVHSGLLSSVHVVLGTVFLFPTSGIPTLTCKMLYAFWPTDSNYAHNILNEISCVYWVWSPNIDWLAITLNSDIVLYKLLWTSLT